MAKKHSKTGGLAFYLSITALLYLAPVLFCALIFSLRSVDAAQLIATFAALSLGAILSCALLRGAAFTLLHEVKHSVLSGLVGNRAKKIVVREDGSGEFRYAYSKETAHYNAFISLAPYIVPLFAAVFSLVAAPFVWNLTGILGIVAAFGLGIDLETNARDVSPAQTDLSDIRGGYKVAALYVILANIALSAFILMVCLFGMPGAQMAASGVWETMRWCVALFKPTGPP